MAGRGRGSIATWGRVVIGWLGGGTGTRLREGRGCGCEGEDDGWGWRDNEGMMMIIGRSKCIKFVDLFALYNASNIWVYFLLL